MSRENMIAELRTMVGDEGVLEATDVAMRSAGAWRADNLKAQALVRPKTTEEVSRVLRWCHDHGTSVVTQGGLTGLVHGADAAANEVILSLERMRNIENINPRQRTATVQAGVILQVLQEEAEKHDLSFPLDLGARGTATIGGNAATNAGGNRVIRYGMMRDMVLGLEVVLADGTIVSSMNQLIKNNAGYDLKHLFIGSEGTLGVITRLVLRLREKPQSSNVAIVALPDFESVARLLKYMDRSLGGTLSAFEVMWQSFYQLVTTAPAKGRPPISQAYPFYVLIESLGSNRELDTTRFNDALEAAMEQELIVDAAISQSDADCHAFWSLRDDVEQVMHGGMPVVFDISLPISEMETFANNLRTALPAEIGEHKLWIFGHLGDGNLHWNVFPPKGIAVATLRPLADQVKHVVHDLVNQMGGSFSAEHGIGRLKVDDLERYGDPTKLTAMRAIKAALDPAGIMNPGAVLRG